MTERIANELLPCPFCGGKAYHTVSANGSNEVRCGCAACGISFKALNVYNAGGEWESSKDVVAAWNTRHDAVVPELEENRRLAARVAELEGSTNARLAALEDQALMNMPIGPIRRAEPDPKAIQRIVEKLLESSAAAQPATSESEPV